MIGKGFYSKESGGNVSNNITFMVNVSNKFVNKTVNSSMNRSFYLPRFVRPDAVKPELVKAGDSWLSINVSLSKVMHGFDHCKLMKNGPQDSRLRLEYTVHKASEEEEHRLRPERNRFREEFGFYRNLPDDERALVTLNGTSDFPQTKVQKWICRNQTLNVNITGLAPYSHYNITFNLLGKYRGLGSSLNNVMTKESEPLRSPLFGISPYSCFSGENDRISCVIYFEEIPRILRHASVTNYILEGFGLTDGHQRIRPECRNFTVKADGQNNSILVENLIQGCVYNISLTAETSMKQNSLSATYILNARDIGKEVEVEVVVDKLNKSHDSYTMFWNNAAWEQTEDVKYYIHYCYTGTKSAQSYICMNNLVTQQENSTWRSSKMLVESYIKPTFFISAVQNGKTSGMVKEKWRYCMHKDPVKVKSLAVRSMPVDSTQLEVVFERADTDADDCTGRPVYFEISWKECSNGCKPFQDSNNYLKVDAYHKGPVTLNGLTDSTDYCVWVKAVGSNNISSSWTCRAAMTGKSNTRVIIVAFILVGLTVFSLGCVLTCCYWRRSKAKIEAMHVPWPKPNTKQSLLYKKPGSAFPFFTKIPATPKHVLSGDSGIEDGGVDGIYTRSMLTESGDNRPCCTQATIGSLYGYHLHIEQEDSQSQSIQRYQLIRFEPPASSTVCDDNDETEDSEEKEELSDSDLSSECSNSSHHSSNHGSVYSLSYSENILSRLPKALFQPSGQGLHERNSDTSCTLGVSCPDESDDDNDR
ncbi:uncharacterized protein LOC112574142 isoform X1 [Pomacea canaliculata]|uniref:uncharacterized protein LOC112574142 isoform X1 n=1 Tax=Pomacea canaliculata TaxID=400727 RepID=UPI000D72A05E|nr:uncharacterized protein LOC112574142 isoform X1 [Pomacea canaliculata]XP_025110797.1 uncharacterized protein LOC112574142 isoform X1 [Pomacea canaliculata]